MDKSFYLNFSENFSKEIIKISIKHIDYINETIESMGDKLPGIYNIEFVIEVIQEINLIAYSIYELNKKGINSTNYNTKLKQYKIIVDKLLDEYGVDLTLFNNNGEVPFSNPTELYVKIDFLLNLLGMNKNQRRDFFNDFLFRERLPKQSDTQDMIIKMNHLLRYHFTEIDDKRMLDHLEIYTMEQINPNLLELYFELLNDDLDHRLSIYQQDEEKLKKEHNLIYSKIGSWCKYSMKQTKKNHFLNYPLYLSTEADTLNELLETDKYKNTKVYPPEKTTIDSSESKEEIPF